MSAVEIKSTEGLNDRCKQVVKAVDSFLHGHELATNERLDRVAIQLKDHHDLTKGLGLEKNAEISRCGVLLYGVS